MTSIKNFTDSNVHAAGLATDIRIVRTAAAQEHLEQVAACLNKDQAIISEIVKALGLTHESEIWEIIPNVSESLTGVELHRSYLNILLRTLLRSDSVEFSENIRARFASKTILKDPDALSLSAENMEKLRAKFINLYSIHGDVKLPTTLDKLKAWVKALFDRIGGEGKMVEG